MPTWHCQTLTREVELAAELEDMWIELQLIEDTCKRHDVFLCPTCFNLEPIGEPIDLGPDA